MEFKAQQGGGGEEQSEQQQQQQGNQQEEGGEEFHVLAVDDSSIDRKILEKLLTVSCCHVTCVESGDKALEYLGLLHNDNPPPPPPHHHHHLNDHSSSSSSSSELSNQQNGRGLRVNLIMTDYSMPGISGYDLLRRVKGSPWKDVPVVVMSSENFPSRIQMCMEGGAEEFLVKPVRMSDLKRLQPHLLKSSAPHPCCNANTTPTAPSSSADSGDEIENKLELIEIEEAGIDQNHSHPTAAKRKAATGEPSERRPKLEFDMEGVATAV